MRRTAALGLVTALTLTAGGCREPVACTAIGAVSGIVVTGPGGVARGVDSVEVEVCQDGTCVSAERVIRPRGGPLTTFVVLEDLAQLDAGPAEATTTLRVGDRVVESVESDLELDYEHPNGPDCDPDIWLTGDVRLGA